MGSRCSYPRTRRTRLCTTRNSRAHVELALALFCWVKGGLGMSVIVVAYFFSDICGSKMAEVSALGSSLMPPLTRAGYDRRDSASLIAAGTAMGMLVPPAIFMIVLAQVTNTSADRKSTRLNSSHLVISYA